ncbi:MAG TPA: hypothetical protein DC058_06720 [Planctomycetaceae bacterium]|nr:hypothetical protein [Planctomycetaceae bacterium]HBC60897.1 hypothetical protein [Planctomycetaceae bacterium]
MRAATQSTTSLGFSPNFQDPRVEICQPGLPPCPPARQQPVLLLFSELARQLRRCRTQTCCASENSEQDISHAQK